MILGEIHFISKLDFKCLQAFDLFQYYFLPFLKHCCENHYQSIDVSKGNAIMSVDELSVCQQLSINLHMKAH